MKIPSKLDLIFGGAALLGAVLLFLVIKGWHDKATIDLPRAEARIDSLEAIAKIVVQQNEISRETDNDTLKGLEEINHPDRKLSPVWVCPPAAGVSATASAVAGESVAAAPGGEPGVSGSNTPRDVSDGATVYGKRCEAIKLELIQTRLWLEKQRELQRSGSGQAASEGDRRD